MVILIVRVGSDEALSATARALGWRSLLVCLPFALIMAVDTLGWRYAFAYDRVPFLRLVAARIAGEAVNVMTAVAPVGGDAIKVWFLRPHVPYQESIASVIVAKTTITLSQALFLRVLQIPASLTTALVIETLGSAVRFATFFVPGSLGALEGANTAAFAALGLGAPAGLAFSLLRRLRQVVWIGLGVLVFLLARARMRLAPEAPA